MNRPLDNILNSYNHDQLHEIPLSAYLSKGSQHLAGGLNRCGTPKGLAVTFALLPSVATTCVAVIETVASLAYAIFTTALHALTFFQIDSLQNHVIKSWAFVRHSFLMIGAPFILLANTGNLDSESVNLRTAFMRLNCAQTAQTIGTVFDALGCRCAHHSVSDLADERAMGAAIESLPKLFEIIEPSSFFSQQKVIKFFAANKDALSNAEEFLTCCRLNDPNKEAFVKNLLTAYKVHHQNDFFGNEDDVLPSPRPLITYNREKGDEAFNNPLNAYPYGRDIYPPRAPLNHERLNVHRFPPNRDDEMDPFDLQALARRLEAEENAKMAAEEAESLRLARELQDQFDLDEEEAQQRELNNRRQQLEVQIQAQRQAQEAEIRRRIQLQQQQQQVNQLNNPPQPLNHKPLLDIPQKQPVQIPPPAQVQVAPIVPIAQQIEEAKNLYLNIVPPLIEAEILDFSDVKKDNPQSQDLNSYQQYMLKLAEKAVELLRDEEREIRKLIVPSEIDPKYLAGDGRIKDSFYEEDYFPGLDESLKDVALLTQFLEILNEGPTCPNEKGDRLQKLEALKNKYKASSLETQALFFIMMFQRNHFEDDTLKTNEAARKKLLTYAEEITVYFSSDNVNDECLTTILELRKSFNELGWGAFGTGHCDVVNKDAYNTVVVNGLS